MTFAFILIAIIAVAEIVWTVWNYMKAEELAEKEEQLDKYSAHLDERANKIAQWEDELLQYKTKQ